MSPSKQERIFKTEYAKELLKIAKEDLKTGKFLFQGFLQDQIRPENLFFILQQCIEKSLKAVLCYQHIPVPLVHDLGILIAKLPSDTTFPFGYELDSLSEFASIRRYEEGHISLTREEAEDVMKISVDVVEWAETIIN